ncbi:MAG: aminopeptidase P family protein [Clostridia bacterium]|nr:aminopeptidase P family protein [Clostridia bacterium]
MEDNIEKLQRLLLKYNIKMWFIVNKDNNDPIFYKYISKHLYTQSFLLLLPNRAYLIISEEDKNNIGTIEIKKSIVNVYTYKTEEEMKDILEGIICSLEYIDKIAMSYSTLGDKDTDIILNSDYRKYTGLLRSIYRKYHKTVRFCSSEKVVYSLISENSEKKLERIKLACKITDEILDMTFKDMYVNMTEIEIANKVLAKMSEIEKKYIGKYDITSISTAWDNCPFVLTGSNLALNGHTPPSNKLLKKGDTINIDFGIKLIFSDGKKIFSDMQRMGYALKSGEQTAPEKVVAMFNTLVSAIDEALDYMKPDVKGYIVDEKIRSYISKAGYPGYMHASGHPVGSRVHASGTIISTRLEPRSKIALVETGVYTLEPKVPVENGASIEEMIVVTKFGGFPAYKFQKELYIIK